MADNNVKYGINRIISAPGSLGIGSVKDEGRVRFVISGANPANLIRVRARIKGQLDWTTLVDLTGNTNQSIDIFTWDQLEVICLTYDPFNVGVTVAASSFDGASLSIEVPGGAIVSGISTLKLASADSSISITANELTGEINLASIGGTATIPFVKNFVVGDWVLGGGQYQYIIPLSTHAKGANPLSLVYESIAGQFERVEPVVEMSPIGDLTLSVSQVPDLRFSGKIIIK